MPAFTRTSSKTATTRRRSPPPIDLMTNSTLGLIAYRAAMVAAQPVVPLFLHRRALRGKELSARRGERLGVAEKQRPPGPLVWFHGASVGECVTALPVIERLMQENKASVLVTSG